MKNVLLIILAAFLSLNTYAQHTNHEQEEEHTEHTTDSHSETDHSNHAEEGGDYNPTPTIMHHIADANEVRIVRNIVLPLPVMIYNTTHNNWFFGMSSQFHPDSHGHGHETVGNYEMVESRVVPMDGSKYIDLSITKNVFWMLVGAFIIFFVFRAMAKAYKNRPNQAPSGLQGFMEPLVDFVDKEIARPFLGAKTGKYLPYLVAVFFFIWLLNIVGLISPLGNPNITGNIAVTASLTVFTFLIIQFSGNKHYWGHIFNPPGVPGWVKVILVPVEILGIFTKPFALMIRLFANITAGHILLLSLVSLIFIFGKAGESLGGSLVGIAISVPFTIFIFLIELLVAALQAYIFTMLSAVFIGQAIEEPHH